MRPVWLCPLRLRDREVAHVPAERRDDDVNVGFWGTVHVGPDPASTPRRTARSRHKVLELGGATRARPRAFYDRETFDNLYDGEPPWPAVKPNP